MELGAKVVAEPGVEQWHQCARELVSAFVPELAGVRFVVAPADWKSLQQGGVVFVALGSCWPLLQEYMQGTGGVQTAA